MLQSKNKIKVTAIPMARIQLFIYPSRILLSGITDVQDQHFSSALTVHYLMVVMERKDRSSLQEAERIEPSISLVAAFPKQRYLNRDKRSLASKCNDSSIDS